MVTKGLVTQEVNIDTIEFIKQLDSRLFNQRHPKLTARADKKGVKYYLQPGEGKYDEEKEITVHEYFLHKSLQDVIHLLTNKLSLEEAPNIKRLL